MYFKLGQVCVMNWGSIIALKIGEIVVTTWASLVSKSETSGITKLRQLLQIWPSVITKWSSFYKLGPSLLIAADITHYDNYYNLLPDIVTTCLLTPCIIIFSVNSSIHSLKKKL